MAFLSGSDSQRYAPQSGEIVGILKQLHDEMAAALKDATDAENAAIASFDALVASKTKEIAALTEQIEVKTQRAGEIAVENAAALNDLEDTKESLVDDKKFVADLEANCAKKKVEYEENQKMR